MDSVDTEYVTREVYFFPKEMGSFLESFPQALPSWTPVRTLGLYCFIYVGLGHVALPLLVSVSWLCSGARAGGGSHGMT